MEQVQDTVERTLRKHGESETARRFSTYRRQRAELARAGDRRIVIAHVEERTVGKGGGPIHANEKEIREELDKLAEQLSDQGIETQVKAEDVMVGGPAHLIASIADEASADLIVTGTRGHTAMSGLLLGSVAHRLLHIAKRPVLVVPSSG